MIGGFGSMQGANNSLKINRTLLKKKTMLRKERTFLNRKREYLKAAGIIDYNTASKEDLALIREKIIKRRYKENLITSILFIAIVSTIIYFTLPHLEIRAIDKKAFDKSQFEIKKSKYDFFIKDGDRYINLNQWHNAMFQYNKAIELFPNDYHAHYRYSYAAVYRCRNKNEKCEEAKTELDKLLAKFPNKDELIELEQVLLFLN